MCSSSSARQAFNLCSDFPIVFSSECLDRWCRRLPQRGDSRIRGGGDKHRRHSSGFHLSAADNKDAADGAAWRLCPCACCQRWRRRARTTHQVEPEHLENYNHVCSQVQVGHSLQWCWRVLSSRPSLWASHRPTCFEGARLKPGVRSNTPSGCCTGGEKPTQLVLCNLRERVIWGRSRIPLFYNFLSDFVVPAPLPSVLHTRDFFVQQFKSLPAG